MHVHVAEPIGDGFETGAFLGFTLVRIFRRQNRVRGNFRKCDELSKGPVHFLCVKPRSVDPLNGSFQSLKRWQKLLTHAERSLAFFGFRLPCGAPPVPPRALLV